MRGRRKSGQVGVAGHDKALDGLLASLLSDVPVDMPVGPACAPSGDSAPPPAVARNAMPAPPFTQTGPRDEAPPTWAQNDFRVLLVGVGAYRFALPLVLMRSIALLPARWTRVPGQPDWHLGVWRYRDTPVVLADLGGLIGVAARCVAPRYVLMIGDGRAGLPCDTVEDTALVGRDAARWRRSTRTPAWLAGMLVEQMCALLDVDALNAAIRHG